MYTHKRTALGLAAATLLAACATPLMEAQPLPQGLNLGRAITADEVKAWDISIPPSGSGLPPGSGSVKQGAAVYAAKCEACHGGSGAGKPADALVGGQGTLASDNPVRTVGSYWPYATTLFDYVRRAMPTNAPKSLTDSEVYAVTAYVLQLNGVIPQDAMMNAQTLPQVKMPNRGGFIDFSGK
ncbi:MAG: c-type cytochrome [Burkholderiaceae bacterium]